ncbi:12848_t:CDS:2 [Ambispora gerdemannii]|uniref:12848_t:CDS:1 n=1 Tax=Ambispora gerdemannii TaxID=144530 RepID=A0A9N9DF14_9GLOM|nr:12848_t:CDS:2 [Ambispora gerdemannii]
MLESVYQQMKHHYKEHGTMDCLFEPVEEVEDKTIKPYLTKVYRDYQNAKKKEQAREQANGERTPHIFIEPTQIIALTN